MRFFWMIGIAMLLFLPFAAMAQREDYIYSKDGKPVLNRRVMVFNCLRGLNKDRSDPVALKLCECQVNSIDENFTQSQYKRHTKNNIVDIEALINEDSLVKARMNDCFVSSGKTILLNAEQSAKRYIDECVSAMQSNSNKKLDSQRVKTFCSCQFELITSRQISDVELKAANDPNSLLFFEMMYRCGNPFLSKEEENGNGWTVSAAVDVQGPAADTVSVLNIGGMSYVKIKIGNQLRIWLIDSGASDMLITKEMEADLKQENILTGANYIGDSEYEMANGQVELCRKYRVSNVRIGKYYLANIVIAVSDHAKRILAGRTLLNKFSNWTLNNSSNTLLLIK